MREISNAEIEKRAIMHIIDYFEPQIDAVIKQSIEEHKKLNELKKIQGLYVKNRIDKKCVENAINTLKEKGYFSVQENGGKRKKIGENNELHTQKGKKQGVEIT